MAWSLCFAAEVPLSTLGTSAPSHQSLELDLWTSVLYLGSFCVSVSKMPPKVIASSLYAILTHERAHRRSSGRWRGHGCIQG